MRDAVASFWGVAAEPKKGRGKKRYPESSQPYTQKENGERKKCDKLIRGKNTKKQKKNAINVAVNMNAVPEIMKS